MYMECANLYLSHKSNLIHLYNPIFNLAMIECLKQATESLKEAVESLKEAIESRDGVNYIGK